MKTLGLVLVGLLMTGAVAFVGYRLLKPSQLDKSVKLDQLAKPTGIVVSTVKEFIDKGSTTVCQIPEDKGVYIAMIKGKKVRVNNFRGMEVLIKDGKVYSWKDGSTKGTIGGGIDKEVYDSLEKNKNLCLNGDAADFVFELPKEVIFK